MLISALLPLLASTVVPPDDISDALSRRCAETLAALARAHGVPFSLSGTAVTLDGHVVATRARIEARQAAQGRHVAALAIEAAVDAQPGLVVGCVGIGRDDAEAVETAVQEWGALVGHALVRGISLRERSPERFTAGRFIVYPGATGFRGTMPPRWLPADHERLLAALERALPLSTSDTTHGLTLTVMVEPGQVPQGEVRFDGIPAHSLWLPVQGFDWPRAAAGYIFKQFYLLVPEKAAG